MRLAVGGEELELLPEELLVESSAPEGYAVAESDGTLVALNTAMLLISSITYGMGMIDMEAGEEGGPRVRLRDGESGAWSAAPRLVDARNLCRQERL